MRFCILVFVAMVPAYGQLSFGLKGGGVPSGGLDPNSSNTWEGKRYTVGATVEFRLPFRLSAEVDALYSRAGDRDVQCAFASCSYQQRRGNVFQFPVLLKYRLLRTPVAPFLSGGVSYRWVRRAHGTVLIWRTGPLVPSEMVDYTVHRSSNLQPAESDLGEVVGVGLEFRIGKLRMAPEVRYTRWNARYWEFFGPRGYFTGSNPNQMEVLFGVTF